MNSIIIKTFNENKENTLIYATKSSAGLDLRANIKSPIILKPMERRLIGTGVYIQLPEGYEAQVRPRSGLALKYGLTVLNSPGTIDADYRGEICIILINLGNEDYEIKPNERVAQLVFAEYKHGDLFFVDSKDELSDTERGTGGFGHTNKF